MSSWSLTFWMGVATWERWIPHNSGKSRKKLLILWKKDSSHTVVGLFYIHEKNAVFWRKIGFFV